MLDTRVAHRQVEAVIADTMELMPNVGGSTLTEKCANASKRIRTLSALLNSQKECSSSKVNSLQETIAALKIQMRDGFETRDAAIDSKCADMRALMSTIGAVLNPNDNTAPCVLTAAIDDVKELGAQRDGFGFTANWNRITRERDALQRKLETKDAELIPLMDAIHTALELGNDNLPLSISGAIHHVKTLRSQRDGFQIQSEAVTAHRMSITKERDAALTQLAATQTKLDQATSNLDTAQTELASPHMVAWELNKPTVALITRAATDALHMCFTPSMRFDLPTVIEVVTTAILKACTATATTSHEAGPEIKDPTSA